MKLINCFQREQKVGGGGWGGFYINFQRTRDLIVNEELQALNSNTAFQNHGLAVCDRHS